MERMDVANYCKMVFNKNQKVKNGGMPRGVFRLAIKPNQSFIAQEGTELSLLKLILMISVSS